METIKNAITLLEAVYETLNTVAVEGFENQSKMVDSAGGIRTVYQALGKFLQDAEAQADQKKKLEEQDRQYELEGGRQ